MAGAAMTAIPGYWMNETSGVLAPVVEKYLNAGELTADELALMRAYLEQWARGFVGPDVAALRARLPLIRSSADLGRWLADDIDAGIDPL
jgi:hypothetical protein